MPATAPLAGEDDLQSSPEELAAGSSESTAVINLLEQLRAAQPAAYDRLSADRDLAAAAVAVAGASRSLGRLIVADRRALDVLADTAAPVAVSAVGANELAESYRLELLRIAARDLTGVDGLEEVGDRLARLGDAALAAAYELVGAPAGLAVIAMGKLGGDELNYSSDLDVVFVSDGTGWGEADAARRLVEHARGAFRVDTGLRPEGRNGALVRSLDSFAAYWERWARPWEFQALLKARWSAGDRDIGARFEQAAAEAVFGRRLDVDALGELRAMKARAEGVVQGAGLDGREIKRGRGGIRDIEFAVQLLQLVHGPSDPTLRMRATLPALAELSAAGYVARSDGASLSLAYRFLRTVEHRLQLEELAQVHTVPARVEARARLARNTGFTDRPERSALDRFDQVLSSRQTAVRSIHERIYFRPLLESFAAAGTPLGDGDGVLGAGVLGSEAVRERLSAFGYRDAERTAQALAELTKGLSRSSRLMQQMMPLLLDWCSASPDPDLALLGLRAATSVPHRRDLLVTAFRESPETARRLCLLLGTSRVLSDLYAHNPDLVTDLGSEGTQRAGEPAGAMRGLAAVLEGRHRPAGGAAALRRLADNEVARIATRDVLGLDELPATGRGLADLGGTVLGASLSVVEPPLPLAVIAMGRLGGRELAYGSDLDVLLVHDGDGPADAAAAEQAAAAFLGLLNGATPAERILRTDTSLRPEGNQGPLVRSLAGYEKYYGRWMQTWERQALLRARPVAGDAAVAGKFMRLVEEVLWERPFAPADERDIRRMKARVERERIPAGDDPQFHLKLGRGSLSDVEWTAQLLQLRHGVRAAGTLEALSLLEAADAIKSSEATVLRQAYRFCELTRNRWHLVGNFLGAGAGTAGADSLPSSPERQSRLARSLGTTSVALREDYRRVTRRSRRVVERLFYDIG